MLENKSSGSSLDGQKEMHSMGAPAKTKYTAKCICASRHLLHCIIASATVSNLGSASTGAPPPFGAPATTSAKSPTLTFGVLDKFYLWSNTAAPATAFPTFSGFEGEDTWTLYF